MGIGKAFCLGLAEAGADVAVADIDETTAKQTAAEVSILGRRSLPLKVDVTKPEEVHSMVQSVVNTFGHLDIGVNNAGGARGARWAENITVENFDFGLILNLRTVFNCAQEEARSYEFRQKKGKIINTASIAGSVVISQATYSASKAGVIMLTKVLAIEWAKYNIHVNAIAPTFIESPFTKPMFEKEGFREYVLGNIPLGRVGQPEDVVGAVIYLASEASNMVTGHILLVDGGWTAH
jgi:NAD(P)-dependent dehydrogenase (short-subunit alcohol dehydrogenase family)